MIRIPAVFNLKYKISNLLLSLQTLWKPFFCSTVYSYKKDPIIFKTFYHRDDFLPNHRREISRKSYILPVLPRPCNSIGARKEQNLSCNYDNENGK